MMKDRATVIVSESQKHSRNSYFKKPVENLTKKVKDLYCENYKTLKKKMEDYTDKWNDIS